MFSYHSHPSHAHLLYLFFFSLEPTTHHLPTHTHAHTHRLPLGQPWLAHPRTTPNPRLPGVNPRWATFCTASRMGTLLARRVHRAVHPLGLPPPVRQQPRTTATATTKNPRTRTRTLRSTRVLRSRPQLEVVAWFLRSMFGEGVVAQCCRLLRILPIRLLPWNQFPATAHHCTITLLLHRPQPP